jgi:hypothetical protein
MQPFLQLPDKYSFPDRLCESVREFRDYSRLLVAYGASQAFFVGIRLSSHGENDVFR